MAIEDFKHLIEAQSLEKTIKVHMDLIEEQKNRVKHIENVRAQASSAKDEFQEIVNKKTQSLNNLEKDLFSAEGKVKKSNEHIPLARNEQEANALQNELETLNPLIEQLQEDILMLMDEVESIQAELDEKKEFLEGSLKSLKAISSEADLEVVKENETIVSLKERVDALLEQTSSVHKNSYLLSNETHRYNNPLCFVTANACHVCRFTLNQVQAVEIEKGVVTESCPGCGRLLTPLSAKTI